ncbi:NAD-dependent epimerase/dehydratase family protein [Microbacterium sp. G2-8]|uniref:NAD-dependent epimerase/dehydratase family protein n=1 Tax=Microbacterium sp. G2-8 TaxID=2842454 RepID=UPI0021A9BDA2|nr:NAD-dependent epimerase/dehydratase family protein [Microbacterium sp. G2-8]
MRTPFLIRPQAARALRNSRRALAAEAWLCSHRLREKKDLHLFSGRIEGVTCPRIAVLGTDGAIGKRTTATLVVQALVDRGIRAVMVGTGQTTIIQGGRYGVALDALVPQFCSGEVENQIVAAFEGEDPDIIIVEGQGALSHPAYLTSAHILRDSRVARAT